MAHIHILMLERLSIQNYAIIDSLEIRTDPQMNIITGETGAGKSILMGALSLILGDRADTSVLRNREKKCVVEGVFQVKGIKNVRDLLKQEDLDVEDELFIRREIGTNGKSRAFVNDTPVNLEQLRKLTGQLVDLHRQFDTLALSELDFQREVLDALAGHQSLLLEYRLQFGLWQDTRRSHQALILQKEQFNKEYDYNKFLYEELAEAAFREKELEEADAELKWLSNTELIKEALNKAQFQIDGGGQNALQQLRSAIHLLQPYCGYQESLPQLVERLQSLQIELKDILSELEGVNEQVQHDPQRLEQLNERIALGYRLQKKHNVNSTAALLELMADLERKLQAVLEIDASIQALQDEMQRLEKESRLLAQQISEGRKKQVKPLVQKVNQLLHRVGMPNASLKVQLEDMPLGEHGMDKVEFLFDANKSNRFEPVGKVASGGELSRLMLCIKSLVAGSLDLPTLIFDEIDTGISGEAAKQVGILLRELSGQRQVICITHQPQIAGKATAHFLVYKEIAGDAIKTNIRLLTQDERITAIAKMLSGEKPTAAALENAREMVSN